jgi:hypothetical protein
MEELRVCTFFDVLGTREIMMGADTERRNSLITLIRTLQERTSNYSPNAQNLGLGVVFSPSAQTTTFSDNVAVSFPIESLKLSGSVGNKPHMFYIEASHFFEHLLIQIIGAVWDGLKIGVLFRGGISVGRLIHDDKIIAGEALVKAVELEKYTKLPRIELAQEVIELLDEKDNPIITDSIKESLENVDGRWFVKTLDLHVGYWRDHNWYLQQQGKEQEDIPSVLGRIRTTLDSENKKVLEEGNLCVIEKWDWFMSQFEDAFSKGNWHLVDGAYEAACKIKR